MVRRRKIQEESDEEEDDYLPVNAHPVSPPHARRTQLFPLITPFATTLEWQLTPSPVPVDL